MELNPSSEAVSSAAIPVVNVIIVLWWYLSPYKQSEVLGIYFQIVSVWCSKSECIRAQYIRISIFFMLNLALSV
jgi:hypothetical protein